jgi:hypothetical protein
MEINPMSMPRTARCRLSAFGEAVLTFPFNRALVNDLKDGIPYRYREYNPTTKEWTVQPEYLDYAISLLLQHFPDADVPASARWQQRRAASTQCDTDDFSTLHLLPAAPQEVIDAAYRALAKIHHPDMGGDAAMMRRLTEAREALGRRLSA